MRLATPAAFVNILVECPWTSPSAPFIFFAAMMCLQLVLVWKFLPETKGVSLEEMQRHPGIE